ncbi:MAG: prepilin peptidase, partial [Clostridiaceae bacterium]
VGFLIFLVPYIMKAMGAGDIKLLAAIGALTDWRTVLIIAVFTALSGGVITLVIRAAQGGLLNTFKRTGRLLLHYFFAILYAVTSLPTMEMRKRKYELEITGKRDEYIPYALAIAVGCIITLIISRTGMIQGLSL